MDNVEALQARVAADQAVKGAEPAAYLPDEGRIALRLPMSCQHACPTQQVVIVEFNGTFDEVLAFAKFAGRVRLAHGGHK